MSTKKEQVMIDKASYDELVKYCKENGLNPQWTLAAVMDRYASSEGPSPILPEKPPTVDVEIESVAYRRFERRCEQSKLSPKWELSKLINNIIKDVDPLAHKMKKKRFD